jgi:hypothetical protein
VIVSLIELVQGILAPFLIIKGVVPLQVAEDVKAQVLGPLTEFGAVNQASTRR